MALYELLLCGLLLGTIHSAPVEISTEKVDNEGTNSDTTISNIEKDAKPTTESDVLTSPPGTATSQSKLDLEPIAEENDSQTNGSESLKPNDFVPTEHEQQTSTEEPQITEHDHILENAEDGHQLNDTHQQETTPPSEDVIDGDSKEAVKQVEVNTPDESQLQDDASIPDGSDIPPRINDKEDVSSSIDVSPNQTQQEPFKEEIINAESANQDGVAHHPPVFPPDDGKTKDIPEDIVEPQNSDHIHVDNIPTGAEPVQEGPTEILQPDVSPPFEPNEESVGMDEEAGNPEEQEPVPFLMNVPEEMVGDPVDLPMREEVDPPEILVRSDLIPNPMLSVINTEQQAPRYDNEEIMPLSDDSLRGDAPEEEIANPEMPLPVLLNFNNRPDESGPMNVL